METYLNYRVRQQVKNAKYFLSASLGANLTTHTEQLYSGYLFGDASRCETKLECEDSVCWQSREGSTASGRQRHGVGNPFVVKT